MVKNTIGGSKTKGQARKHITAVPTHKLRYAESEEELYAKVTALYGNGIVEVLCIDKKKRLCHIRGKFRGRGKRDNFITRDTWILAGKRTWESDEYREVKGKIKLPNCDLLEVYSDEDKEKLKQTVKNINWRLLSANMMTSENVNDTEDIQFLDNGQDEYYEMMNQNLKSNKLVHNIAFEEEEEVNIDDI